MYKREQKMIDNILDNFDFEKCRKAMIHLNWTWGFVPEIPSIERMKDAAVQRIHSAIDVAKKSKNSHFTYFSSSGGFKASVWKNRYGHIEGINLEFILTGWESDGDY